MNWKGVVDGNVHSTPIQAMMMEVRLKLKMQSVLPSVHTTNRLHPSVSLRVTQNDKKRDDTGSLTAQHSMERRLDGPMQPGRSCDWLYCMYL